MTFEERANQLYRQLQEMKVALVELRALHKKELEECRSQSEVNLLELQQIARERGLDRTIEQFAEATGLCGAGGSK
jgi:hypothetical protein